MNVLLAEADTLFASDVVRLLNHHGIRVDIAANGSDALQMGRRDIYSCSVVNHQLPVIRGLTVIRNWRELGQHVPVLLLSDHDDWDDKSSGFEAGADDYLVKPFRPEELVFRIKALSRRARLQPSESMICGNLALSRFPESIKLDGRELTLTTFEFRVLSRLVVDAECPVPKQNLLEEFYGKHSSAASNALEVIIGRLRR